MRTEMRQRDDNGDRLKEISASFQRILDPKLRPPNYSELSSSGHVAWVEKTLQDVYSDVPESMRFLVPGMIRPGDCGRPADEKPAWLDLEKFEKGQRFARDNFFTTLATALMGFFMVYSFQDGVRAILMTQKSSTPYNAFVRYLRSVENMMITYRSNPWKKGTEAYRDIQTVRRAHDSMRKKYSKLSMEELAEKSKIKNFWCPMQDAIKEDYRSACPAQGPNLNCFSFNQPSKAPLINQADMSMTQFGFMGLLVTHPEDFGVSAEDEGLKDFCHFWRGLGYLYGIEDEYNFCNGTLDEIRERCRDMIEYGVKPNFKEITPEWEHVTRCMTNGVNQFIPGPYEVVLIHLCNVINVPAPRTYAKLGLVRWLQLKIVESYVYFAKIPGFVPILNKIMHYSVVRALNASKDRIENIKKKSDELMSGLPESY